MNHRTLAPGYSLHPDGHLLVPLRGKHGVGRHALVDVDDHDKVAEWNWYVNHHGYSYGQRQTRERIRLQVFLHHLILFTPAEKVCDHINGDRLDNRKSNLRVATFSVNNRNRRRRDNRYKGVFERDGGWNARVKTIINGKYVNAYLGWFNSEEEAAEAYDAAVKGMDARIGQLNFPDRDIPPMSIAQIRGKNGVAQFSSSFTGVSWLERLGKWQAYDTVNRRQVYLGVFAKAEEAARVVDAARVQRGAEPVNFA